MEANVASVCRCPPFCEAQVGKDELRQAVDELRSRQRSREDRGAVRVDLPHINSGPGAQPGAFVLSHSPAAPWMSSGAASP